MDQFPRDDVAASPAAGRLNYSAQPAGSLATCMPAPDGGVTVTIPPVMRRPLGRIILGVCVAGCVVGILGIVLLYGRVRPGFLYPFAWLLLPSIGCLLAALWMGFRWTIISAGPRGLSLELRGLLITRRRAWPREQIGSLRRHSSILVLDHNGQQIGKIDATDSQEESWVMQVLRSALDL